MIKNALFDLVKCSGDAAITIVLPWRNLKSAGKNVPLIVQRALRLFAMVLVLCLTMLLSLVCFKPWKDLRSLEHERSFLQARLEKAREQMEQSKNEFIWISQDPHYFEMDRAGQGQPGPSRRTYPPLCGTQAPEIRQHPLAESSLSR